MMQRYLTMALAVLLAPAVLLAQGWNTPRVRTLVERATERRAAQLADTGLRSYKAEARGYLTFLAQMGEGFPEPPKIIRTDQIASDLYWRAPDQSKQMIKGRRDTLLLPTDIAYHRDHLGIVQNNFPNIIRLGEGDEVRDVPHPLSLAGLETYDFAIRDSLQILLGTRTLNVYEVLVRPKNDREPRVVGSVYLDRESADVVRMTLSFTRAALLDKSLEDVSIVLENGLIDGRFWLPRHQEIEIRRVGTWLDYPVRGIIRGRWEISDYDINSNFNVNFAGPEIVLAPGSHATRGGTVTNPSFAFQGNILDSLPPDVRMASDADVRKVQDEARALVRQQALARSRTLALSGRRVSDFAHINRVEGFAPGVGLLQRLGGGFAVSAGTSYGFSDKEWKVRGGLQFTRPSGAEIVVQGYRRLQDVSDVQERSGVINSFAAQEFGSDYTDLYRVRGAALTMSTSTLASVRWSLGLAYERHDSAGLHAKPAAGTYQPVLPVPVFRETRVTIGMDVPSRAVVAGFMMDLSAHVSEIRGHLVNTAVEPSADRNWLRGAVVGNLTHPFGRQTLVLQTIAAGITGQGPVPIEHLVYVGGPISAPGYDFHLLAGRAAVSQRVEWRFPVPFPSIPLGAFGRSSATVTLAPYGNAAWVDGIGWKPSVGVGALTLFDLFRFDVARGLHDGRWSFGFDVSRTFWGIL